MSGTSGASPADPAVLRGARVRAPAILARLRAALRWDEWYASKVPFVWTACATAALTAPLDDATILLRTAAVILFTCLCGGFGYVVNDYADRECDRLAGKPLRMPALAEPTILFVSAALAAAAAGVLALVATSMAAAAAGIGTLVLAALYSLRPVRLKERGAAALWAAAAAQRTLPTLLAFAAFGSLGAVAWSFAAVAQGAGVRGMLVHQVADKVNDRRSGVATFVTLAGDQRAAILLSRVVVPLELAAVVVALAIAAQATPWLWGVAAAGILVSATWAALSVGLQRPWSLQGWERQPLAGFYEVVWPAGTCALLVADRPELWPLAAAFLLWQHKIIGHRAANSLRLLRRAPRRGEAGPSPERLPPAATRRRRRAAPAAPSGSPELAPAP